MAAYDGAQLDKETLEVGETLVGGEIRPHNDDAARDRSNPATAPRRVGQSPANNGHQTVSAPQPVVTGGDEVRLGDHSHVNRPLCHALEEKILSSGTVVAVALEEMEVPYY